MLPLSYLISSTYFPSFSKHIYILQWKERFGIVVSHIKLFRRKCVWPHLTLHSLQKEMNSLLKSSLPTQWAPFIPSWESTRLQTQPHHLHNTFYFLISHLLSTETRTIHMLFLSFKTSPLRKHHCPYFVDEEIEAQKNNVLYPAGKWLSRDLSPGCNRFQNLR